MQEYIGKLVMCRDEDSDPWMPQILMGIYHGDEGNLFETQSLYRLFNSGKFSNWYAQAKPLSAEERERIAGAIDYAEVSDGKM